MGTPILISASGSQSSQQGAPFLIGGNLYACMMIALEIAIFKSTDGGNTWVQQDAAHQITMSSRSTPCYVTDGTIIYSVYTSVTSVMGVVEFNTSTGLWSTNTVTTNSPTSGQVAGYRASDQSIIVLGTPDSLLINPGPSVEQRLGTFVFDTNTHTATNWVQSSGSTTADNTDWQFGAVLEGNASEFILISMQQPVPSALPGTATLYYQTFTGTTAASVNPIDTSSSGNIFWLNGYSNGSEMLYCWMPDIGSTPETVNFWKSPTAPIGWSKEVVTAGSQIYSWTQSIDQDGTIEFLASVQDGALVPLFQYQDSGTGFGLPSTVLTNEDVGVMSALTINSNSPGWGIQFSATGGVYYLASTTVAPSPGVAPLGVSNFAPIPSLGAVCRFARDKRPGGKPPRTIQVGKTMTYPEWYVQ